jgi:hypothetical protein
MGWNVQITLNATPEGPSATVQLDSESEASPVDPAAVSLGNTLRLYAADDDDEDFPEIVTVVRRPRPTA